MTSWLIDIKIFCQYVEKRFHIFECYFSPDKFNDMYILYYNILKKQSILLCWLRNTLIGTVTVVEKIVIFGNNWEIFWESL